MFWIFESLNLQVICNQLFRSNFSMRLTNMVPVFNWTTLPWTQKTSIQEMKCEDGKEDNLSECRVKVNPERFCPSQRKVLFYIYIVKTFANQRKVLFYIYIVETFASQWKLGFAGANFLAKPLVKIRFRSDSFLQKRHHKPLLGTCSVFCTAFIHFGSKGENP